MYDDFLPHFDLYSSRKGLKVPSRDILNVKKNYETKANIDYVGSAQQK